MIKHNVTLDVSRPDVQCVLKMTKGDTSTHEIFVTFRNRGENVAFTGNESAYLHAKKPDGTVTVTSGAVYTSDGVYANQAVFTLTQLTLAAVGRVELRTVIDSIDGEELFSPIIAVDVVQNPALDTDITSQSEYTALTNAKLDAEAWARGTKGGSSVGSDADQYHNNAKYYAERVGSVAEEVKEAEAWAKGTKGGTAVDNEDEQYHDNAKYHAEQAYSLASAAGTFSENAEAWANGTKGGTDVGSGDAQYHNNAKYYAEQAANSKQTILTEIRGDLSTLTANANTALSLAQGATQATSYANYSAMVSAVSALPAERLLVGQNIYVMTRDVPDLWVCERLSSAAAYTYTTDADFVSALKTNGYISIGFYKLAPLETEKVDLSGYVETSDVDDTMSSISENPVQNKVVKAYVDGAVANIDHSAAIVTKTANFTLALTNAGKFLKCNKASAMTVTIPTNASVAFSVGTEIELCQYGAGAVTVAAASGVTIYSSGSMKKTAGQYACVTLKKLDTDIWLLAGGLAS